MKTEVYILTYNKEITEDYDSEVFKPLICGANSLDETHGYLCDNIGDNISDLNKYYTELTGQYWAWKNSDADIIGFCHYRRWFVKNFRFDKITKEDILKDLETYDIILPHNLRFSKSIYEIHKETNTRTQEYDVRYEDYYKIESVLEKYSPEYLESYRKVMNGKFIYTNNMFICRRELADKYFEWVFFILKKLETEIDLSAYESRDPRIFGFIGERLFTSFVLKHRLNAKEYDLYCSENLIPYIYLFNCRFPKIQDTEYAIYFFLKNLPKKLLRK